MVTKKQIKLRWLLMASFLVTVVGQLLDYVDVIDSSGTVLKYFFLMLPLFVGILILIFNSFNNHKKYQYTTEIKIGLVIFASFLLISFQKIYQQHQFTIGTLGESIRILTPFIYTFLAINFLTEKDIDFLMKVSLLAGWVGFLFDNGLSNFTLQNLLSISFVNSYSPFENSEVSLLAFALCVYFIYRYKQEKNYTIAALILNFLVFKRVYVVSVIILFIVAKFKKDLRLNRIILYIGTVGFILVTFFYYYMLLPQNFNWTLEKMHINVATFSMSRAYRLWYVENRGFQSFGLGSSTALLNTHPFFRDTTFELDLVKIIWELGFVAVIIFIVGYIKTARTNLYSVSTIFLFLLQLLMASGLTGYYEIFIIFITIGLINYPKSGNLQNNNQNLC